MKFYVEALINSDYSPLFWQVIQKKYMKSSLAKIRLRELAKAELKKVRKAKIE